MRNTIALALAVVLAPVAGAQSPVLISTDPAAVPSQTSCGLQTSSSFDGRWVGFTSAAPNLSPNGQRQVFLKDLSNWGLEYVSLSTAGTPGDAGSDNPKVSWDGRYVAFDSRATNLIAGDTNGAIDAFLRDRWTAQTTRESLGLGGAELNADSLATGMSADGRYLLFGTWATNVLPGHVSGHFQHYLRDRLTGTVEAAAVTTAGLPTNGDSIPVGGGVSADGRYIVFSSLADNLVLGDTNGVEDVFLRDLQAGTLTRLSQEDSGQGGDGASTWALISEDGGFVVFSTEATNLVVPDLNGTDSDVLLYDVALGTLERVDVTSGGQQANAYSRSNGLSWDGRYVVFESLATNLAGETLFDHDTFVHDRVTGATELVTPATPSVTGIGSISHPSPNGRFAILVSPEPWDPAHPAGTTQVYAVDRGPICLTPYTYCTGKTNSLGCDPWVASYGCSSATLDSGFFLHAGNVRNNKVGMLFYGVSGQVAKPFQGGTMCVSAPKKRTPIRNSLGNPAPANDCSGLWTIDLNAFAAGLGGGNPLPTLSIPGTIVSCQWWGRDPGAPFNTSLTNAIEFLVGP